jgi:membrane-bound lytic murein transglycosylase D
MNRFLVLFALLSSSPAIAEELNAESSTVAAIEEVDTSTEAITADLEGPDDDASAGHVQKIVADPNEQLEIGWQELEHDAQFDPIAAQELLDAITKIDPLDPTQRTWPPEHGPTGPTYDIPMAEDERVDMWLSYFQKNGRERYQIWLSRITRYAPIFWPVLDQHGLPKDTVFLSMIESGFSTRATSWAAAAGPWQFMPATARRYGLEVSFWVDERRDFELSTHAACEYLKDLYQEFGDWMLAWAAYNTGENRIRRGVKRSGLTDFWKLSRTRLMMRETKHYVPKLMAAALIAKQPAKYGIEPPEYLPQLDWETITVTTAIDLKTLAESCRSGVTEEDLLTLNPALYRGIVPPGREYTLRVPRGRGASCAMGLSFIPHEKRFTYRYHRVKRGDTVALIAKQYRTTADAIVSFNKLDASKLAVYDALVVPVPATMEHEVPIVADVADWNRNPPYTPLSGSAPMQIHRVRAGDSLWRIARKYGVSLSKLKSANGLARSARLRIGQQLRIQR